MRVIADLHIHSPYSRAVSPQMTINNISSWCVKKGIKVVGTGDFTHPLWLKHLQESLEPAERGLFKCKGSNDLTRFMLTCEVSSIYSDGGKVRRVHNLIFAPSFEVVEKIILAVKSRGGKLASDGRPIVGLSSRALLNIVLEASPECLFVPAHAWTPWFAIFGSKSGYDSLEECFGEDTKYIHAIETGLSSDPSMNWQISSLDKITLISNSDPHSLHRLGREANVFDIPDGELSYREIVRIIKEKDTEKFKFTIEYYPEEGRYHNDGDKEHGISFSPEESQKYQQKCPQCGRRLTVGVLSRVRQLSDRPEGFLPKNAIPGRHLVPLEEIIADSLGLKSVSSKKVVETYQNLVDSWPEGELGLLLDASIDHIASHSNNLLAEGIRRVRSGELSITPGYDGVYGKVSIFSSQERDDLKSSQKRLF